MIANIVRDVISIAATLCAFALLCREYLRWKGASR